MPDTPDGHAERLANRMGATFVARADTSAPFVSSEVETPPEVDRRNSALIAAAQASEAVAELLRYHREGPQAHSAFGDVDVVEKLAEAVLLAGRIAIDELNDGGHMREYRDEIGQLAAAAARFIAGWAG